MSDNKKTSRVRLNARLKIPVTTTLIHTKPQATRFTKHIELTAEKSLAVTECDD